MERSCYRCNAAVEEGTPFCPQCRAPQIRVSMGAETIPPEVGPAGDIIPPRLPYGTAVLHPSGLSWPHALAAASRAGIIASILMLVPLPAFFFLGMFAAGFLAVALYRRRLQHIPITSGLGARLGALSGTFGFFILCLFLALTAALFRGGEELRKVMLQAMQQAAARNPDPETAQRMMEYVQTPQGMTVLIIAGLGVMFVMFVIFSSLGGVLGASYARRKGR